MADALSLVPVDVAALELLPIDERVNAIATAYRQWRRVKVVTAWTFGRALWAIRGNYSTGSGDWGAVLDRIGIEHSKARRFMRIADGHDSVQIARYSTVDAAYKALPAKRPAPEPAPEPAPGNTVVTNHDIPAPEPDPDPDPEEVVAEVAAEEEREHPPVPVVFDEVSEVVKLRRRHREDVATINAERRATAAERRKNRDVCDALLSAPTCPNCDAVLARFFGVQRPAA